MIWKFLGSMGVKKITICHKRGDCIGCGSCALIAPHTWRMNQADGKADLIGATQKGKDFMVAQIDDEESIVAANKQAADACPVQIIRITGHNN